MGCVGGGTEVGIGLLRGGLLSVFLDKDFAGEGSHGLVIDHVLVEFVGLAVGHLVVDEGIVVNTLLATADGTSVEGDLGVLACEVNVAEVACLSVEEGNAVVLDGAVMPCTQIDVGESRAQGGGLFDFVEVETAIVVADNFHHLGGEELLLVGGVVVDDDGGFGSRQEEGEDAAVHHGGSVATKPVVHHDGVFHLRVLRHVNQQGIMNECRVESGEGVGDICHLVVVGCHIYGSILQMIDIGGRLDRERRERDAVVRGKGSIHIGITVAFHLLGGEERRLRKEAEEREQKAAQRQQKTEQLDRMVEKIQARFGAQSLQKGISEGSQKGETK